MSAPNPKNPTTAVSAPGKVLLTGGYLVLDSAYSGLVFSLDARINVVAQEITTSEGVQLSEIVVESPQFHQAQWRYGYHLADEDGGIKVTQLQVGSKISPNPFVETTLSFALTYISRVTKQRSMHSFTPARLTILADNDYYSQPSSSSTTTPSSPSSPKHTHTRPGNARFARFPTTLSGANKTGLGSSAALVTSLTAALLTHYLPHSLFDLTSPAGRSALHNLAQAAHCAAQGKVGSGFDVAAAVHGSCRYTRFSPSLLSGLPEPGAPGFGAALQGVVDSEKWDVVADTTAARLAPGIAIRMCDVTCGSQTVGMVKTVLGWRTRESERAREVWDELQKRNDELAALLAAGATEEVPAAVRRCRELVRAMGEESGAPIEPRSQTELIDGVTAAVEGVYGGVVPGAGGLDALALLMRDDEETKKEVDRFLEKWSGEKNVRVRLLGVKGGMDGVRVESLKEFEGWL